MKRRTETDILVEALNRVWPWLKMKYGLDPRREHCRIKLSRTCRFAKIVHGSLGRNSYIRIDARRAFWLTYELATVGKVARRVPCSLLESYSLQLVHELTHFIQYVQNRKASEVETTENEIEYAKIHFNELYRMLEPVKLREVA